MSVLDQYSHANRCVSFHQQFSVKLYFVLKKNHYLFIKTNLCVIQEIFIYLLTHGNIFYISMVNFM